MVSSLLSFVEDKLCKTKILYTAVLDGAHFEVAEAADAEGVSILCNGCRSRVVGLTA